MKIFLTLFVLFFSSNVHAELINCVSNQFGVVYYDSTDSVMRNKVSFKIKIEKDIGKIFFEEVLEDAKTSEQSSLFKDQSWIITSTSADTDIRAYGSIIGELYYATNKKILNVSFPLGDGSVGVTVSDCY